MTLPEEFHELARRVRNWGRWGEDDEVGTLNLITSEAVRRGTEAVRQGRPISLALPLHEEGPQAGFIRGRENPRREMIAVNEPMTGDPEDYAYSDDRVDMGLQAATHWDALAHVSYGGRIYNGYPASSVTDAGAARCGIGTVRTLVTRGVLLDVAEAHGLERLEPGHPVTPDDLDAAVEHAAVGIQSGDVILVRTGQIQVFRDEGPDAYAFPTPGLTMATAVWFHDRDVAAVATDTLALEVFPGERDDLFLPVHLLHLVDMGMTQGQNFDLEELAEACAGDGRYDFLLSASPEPFVGGLGAPVNPVAIR